MFGSGLKGAGASYNRYGMNYHHIFKDRVMKVVPSGKAVLGFASQQRDEALEMLATFM